MSFASSQRTMLVVHMLLPRFLVLEIVLFFHFLHNGHACRKQIQRGLDHIRAPIAVNETVSMAIVTTATPPLPPRPDRGCVVDLHDHSVTNLPLFYHPLSEDFLLPQAGEKPGQRMLALPWSEPFTVSCPGAYVQLVRERHVSVMCLGEGGLLDVSGQVVPWTNLTCSRSIRERVERDDRAPCGPEGRGVRVVIGWLAPSGSLKPQIQVCHDPVSEATFYARHTLFGGAIGAREVASARPSYFKEGGFYKQTSANQAYKLRTQRETLKSILGPVVGARIFNYKTSYLAKGHLAPDADFIYREWQRATYYFLNVAPQWQSFNNGNWKAVEAAVRNYASLTGANLDVFTGTLDPLKLQSDAGIPKALHLARKDADDPQSGFDLIPVPEFFWKLVYHPGVNQAIVFVGLNDPFFEGNPDREMQICPDICASQKWFFLYQKNIAKGYTYCCRYQDFQAVIDWVPDVGNPEVLENILPF
eukprot:snap_masked-scaffold541_size141817-processed-gene-0.7 protein:Tk05604 transcript:snap_masked-scaffold541_size141817-processed-gene-0.7-mRNA-1 annotation:"duplex-specific nuclease"